MLAMTLEPVFTVQQIARWLQVSERTIWRWIEDGQLKVIRFKAGKKAVTRISQSEVERIGGRVLPKEEGKADE